MSWSSFGRRYAALNALLALLLFGEVASNLRLTAGLSVGAVLTVASLVIALALLGLSGASSLVRLPVIFWIATIWFLFRGVSEVNYIAGLQQTATWLLFITALLAARLPARSPDTRRRLYRALTGLAVYWGLLQLSFAITQVLGLGVVVSVGRPTAALLVILFSIPITAALTSRAWTPLLTSLLLFMAILVSESRTATVAAVMLAAVTWLIEVTKRLFWVPRRQLSYGVLGAVILALAFGSTSLGTRLESTFEALPSLISDPSSGVARGLTQGRSYVWPRLVSFAMENPQRLVFGDGAGAASAVAALITTDNPWDHPHNEFLRVLIDYGAVGLVLMVLLLARMAVMFAARYRASAIKGSRSRAGPLAGLGALVAFIALMLTDNPLTYPYVMVAFGLIAGLGVSHGERVDNDWLG